jgi:hypothetical protein
MNDRVQQQRDRLRQKLAQKRARQNGPQDEQQQAVQQCVSKGTLAVMVVRSGKNTPIANASVSIKGNTPGSGSTDQLGAITFPDRDPGPYTVSVKLNGKESNYRWTVQQTEGTVSTNNTTTLWFKATPVGNLFIEVWDDHDMLVKEATIEAHGASSVKQQKTGAHKFEKVLCGQYKASASVPADKYEPWFVSAQNEVEVPDGGTAKVRLQVKRLVNTVKPKIEMEYKVVVLDRKLSTHQEATETKIETADVTYIQVSATQTPGPKYTGGGKFEVSPANVKVYTDMRCTKELVGGKLTSAQLCGGAPFILYLKARTKGKFKAKLTLDPSNNPAHIKVEGPAEEEMGVVEIEMKFHRYDEGELDALQVDPTNDPIATYHNKLKDKALPEQKALTHEQKVKEGRFLHVQDANHHDRAKLVVKKLVADQWPGGTDDYDVTLKDDSGTVTLYDKQSHGTEKPLPHKIKVKDLKAKDLELWVAGKGESAKVRDSVLDIGLDRDPGGLAKEAKDNADWGRLTVVKITKVELVVTVPGGKPKVWDSGKKRYYINTEGGAAGRTLGDKAGTREVKVVATLSKAIKDVPIHFMLAPHPDNAAPAGLPATWKPHELKVDMRRLDRTDRKALMHFSEKTNDQGKAEMKKLVLSAFGGDKFTPAAYIEQDPHLAKYVEGHAQLGTRVPKLSSDTLQVWKRFDYRIVYMKRHDGTSYSNRFTEASLQAKFEVDFIEMERAGDLVEADHQDMVPYDTARNWVTGKLGAEKPRQLQFAFVDAIGKAPELDHELSTVGLPGSTFDWPVRGGLCFDMSAQNKWLTSAELDIAGTTHPISGGKVTLANDGVNHKVSINLTGLAVLTGVDLATVGIKIVLKKHDFPSGLSWGAPTLVGMRWRDAGYPGQEPEATMRTAYHESGHYLGLAPKTLPDTAASASTMWYNSPGVGNHCKYGPEDCALWHQFIMKINFCPTCKLALRARDHSSQVNADTPF